MALPWAATPEEREEREAHARRLVGQRIDRVRYFEIDYHRIAQAEADESFEGERLVTAPDEWDDPTWRAADFDSIDYGLELVTTEDRTFSSIWELRGFNEGLTFREEQLRPKRLVADGAFAIWEVQRTPRWAPFLVSPVTDVRLLWDDPERGDPACCFAVELRFGHDAIVLTLGEERDGELAAQPDNVAVVFGVESARRLRVGPFAPGLA